MNKKNCLAALALSLWLMGCADLRTSSLPPTSFANGKAHSASLGTNKIHYLTTGKGRHTVVFIHGWACQSGFWREQVPALAGKARLILIDLPGHGQSDQPHAEYTMDFFARAVLAVMRDARANKATLVGHSMGTPIICRVYAQAPEKVAALVAVDGILRRPVVTSEQIEQFIGPYRTAGYREHASRFISSMFPNPDSEALRDRVLSEMLATPQHVMNGAMQGMFGAGQPAWDLPKVNVPVLVINAPNPMWTPDYEAYVRSLSPQTDYRVIGGAGHFLMLEKPAEFNAALADMLERFGLVAQ
ncbi:MAG: alpha/beta hydrolase [Verrucomicrobia bacterium]|nr:alpha/beta hydrolase [Verrucomicrobiota bacterium]